MRGASSVAALALVAAIVAAAAPVAHAASGAELTEAQRCGVPGQDLRADASEAPRPAAERCERRARTARTVEGLRIVPGDAAGAKTFGAVLVIDTSQSMRGAPIAAAMAAARRFAERRPAQQRLGVVFFNRDAAVALRPTTDAARIAAVLASPPPLAKGTRIYDATALAMRVLARRQGLGGVGGRALRRRRRRQQREARLPWQTPRGTRRRAIFSVGLRSRSYDGSTLRDLARVRPAGAMPRPTSVSSRSCSPGSDVASVAST